MRGAPLRDEVSSALEEDVREPALLVDDAADKAVVVNPRGRRTTGEALDASERRVLFKVNLGCMSIRQ